MIERSRLACLGVCMVLVACSAAPPLRAPEQSSQQTPSHSPPAASAPSSTPVASRLSAQQAADVTIYAIGLVGTPYRFGGNTPAGGFDCSGLIGHVYQKRAAILAPRTVARLQFWGQEVPTQDARSGDLVIFGKNGTASHAGIYVGENRFVHAPSTGGEVRLDSLKSKYWAQQQVSIRRP